MIKVLYNGECPVCSLEINQYKKYVWNNLIDVEFENLHETDMAPWGVTQDQAERRLHVMTEDGEVVSGVDAFILLWRKMPRYRFLADAAEKPGLYQFGTKLYDNLLAPALYHKNQIRKKYGCSKKFRSQNT